MEFQIMPNSTADAIVFRPAIQSTSPLYVEALTTGMNIRVLTVENRAGLIQCRLSTVDLSTNPMYYALSYEWAYQPLEVSDPKGNFVRIFVNGTPKWIKWNLFHALTRFSDDNIPGLDSSDQLPRPFWIDALCINQQNIEERNHQVRLMGNIYTQAKEVLVWLGNPRQEGAIHLPMELLSKIAVIPTSTALINYLHQNLESVFERMYTGRSKLSRLIQLEKGWHEIILPWCTESYWSRIWITQEIELAKSIQIYQGTWHMPWKDLEGAARKLQSYAAFALNHKEAQNYMRAPEEVRWFMGITGLISSPAFTLSRSRAFRSQSSTLKDWMILRSDAKSSERRDMVYALFALASDAQSITVDYSKNLAEVYRDVMKLYISPKGPLEKFDRELISFSSLVQEALCPLQDGGVQDLRRLGRFMTKSKDESFVWTCGKVISTVEEVEPPRFPDWADGRDPGPVCDAAKLPDKAASTYPGQLIWFYEVEKRKFPYIGKKPTVKQELYQFDEKRLSPSKIVPRAPEPRRVVDGDLNSVPLMNYRRLFLAKQIPKTDRVSVFGPQGSKFGDSVIAFPKSPICLVIRNTEGTVTLVGKGLWERKPDDIDSDFQNYKLPTGSEVSRNTSFPHLPNPAVFMRWRLDVFQTITEIPLAKELWGDKLERFVDVGIGESGEGRTKMWSRPGSK